MELSMRPQSRSRSNSGVILLALLAGVLFAGLSAPPAFAQKKVEKKSCLECHSKFVETVKSYASAHPGVREGKCEDCHLRHGLVPKLLLKKDGNALCESCHTKASIGLDKPQLHTPLKHAKCTVCHDPHGGPGAGLLKAQGAESCYQCHDRKPFEQAVVHAPLKSGGCAACHASHSADQPDLLLKPKAQLCAECHDAGKEPFRKAHEGYPVQNADCSLCHDPHS